MPTENKDFAKRLSISLPESLAESLDRMVMEKGFESRSQAIAEMVNDSWVRHMEVNENLIMAGTINITYERSINDCANQIAAIEHKYLRECIASLHVQLEHGLTLEVVLVQGYSQQLRKIANAFLAVKGVVCGQLNINTHILPPIETTVN